MAKQAVIPLVSEAVVLIVNQKRQVLLHWKGSWNGFCLPITKVKVQPTGAGNDDETWEHAAGRAASEVMEGTFTLEPQETLDGFVRQIGNRTKTMRGYGYRVFRVKGKGLTPRPGQMTKWLLPDEIVSSKTPEITKTAVLIVACAQRNQPEALDPGV